MKQLEETGNSLKIKGKLEVVSRSNGGDFMPSKTTIVVIEHQRIGVMTSTYSNPDNLNEQERLDGLEIAEEYLLGLMTEIKNVKRHIRQRGGF